MKYRLLGSTGVQVSQLCFGTMSFGGDADEKDSRKMYEMCRDNGINFFDCANIYQKGLAEEILGRCFKGHRDEIILTSKAGFAMSEKENSSGASHKNLRLALEASLKRLGTDYLDIYFIHKFDENTPIEETLSALDQFVREGKILYAGASNFAAWQIMKALGISAGKNLSGFKCLQPMYNLLKRQAEVEILPMAESESLGVITYSPLAGGLLSGKYLRDEKAAGRLTTNKKYQSRYKDEGYIGIISDFIALADELSVSPVSLAVSWVAHHSAVTSAIIGARNTDQLQGALDSLKIDMTESLRQRISDLSVTPPPPTDRSEEV